MPLKYYEYSATPETPDMTKEEVDMFLERKFMLQMSTLDEKGEPNTLLDKEATSKGKFYIQF